MQRVERRHRILVDASTSGRRGRAPSRARTRARGRARAGAPAPRDARARRQQPHERERRQRLAAARLADDPEPAARAHVERDAAHRPDRLAPRQRRSRRRARGPSRTTSVEVSEQRRRHEREGSRTFWRLSPSVFRASTATRITMPGKIGYVVGAVEVRVALLQQRPPRGLGRLDAEADEAAGSPRRRSPRRATRLARATSTGSAFGSSSRATIRFPEAPTETAAR